MLLDKYPLPVEYKRKNKQCFLDPIRNILILKTPEEVVRQRMVSFLQDKLKVPKEMIMLEEPMTYFKKGAKGRADIIVYRKEEDGLYPVILIECKSPNVELTDDVFEQAVRYDQIVLADALVLTNGNKMEWYGWNEKEDQYVSLAKIPTYQELLENNTLEYNMNEPYIWERPNFEFLRKKEIYQQFLDNVWIGEGTDPSLQEFIMNLSGCLQDSRDTIPPGIYQGVKVIKDGGIRYARFGNVAGGSWIGDYRYVLIKDDENNTQIISMAVLGQMKAENHPVFGNPKGHSFLVIAIDDFEKSHNSLQLNLDRFIKKDGDIGYVIWHDGKLTNGNKGSVKKSLVIEYIKMHAPELLYDKNRVFLGRFENSKNIQFSDEEMKSFFGRVIKYALVRDEFRKSNR
ncbi:type I restriction enzyme HsdR N-terminal domain-containing protein [Bacillus sp. HNG]|uniref:type I restriction enzyme HsdR N-terminal domain-containing protein n=1 Tax=Bacillus sp. HNG TaxID=2293325 RepID=UPI0016733871|nr:type I restriction enzyme HsdR N-terminal domain-containing protein [Bacillus sp. HNG]